MSKTAKRSRLTRALLETADDMRAGDLIERDAHEKIITRHQKTPAFEETKKD